MELQGAGALVAAIARDPLPPARRYDPTNGREVVRTEWSDGRAVEDRIRQQRLLNGVHTALLLGGLVLLPPGLAWLLFGTGGLIWMLLASAVLLFFRHRVPTG